MSSAEIPIEGLSFDQKMQLMERLWVDLSKSNELASPAWHGDLLAKRREAVLKGETTLEDWTVVRETLRNRYK